MSLTLYLYAAMAELVDALDSGSSRGNSVDVRVILAAFSPYSEESLHYALSYIECHQPVQGKL